jgi:negative regulator of flagellin synthesis FlgM
METQAATSAGQLACDLSAKAPIDLDRVARIKKAIADGTFPIVPATIADQMLALKLNWVPHDAA